GVVADQRERAGPLGRPAPAERGRDVLAVGGVAAGDGAAVLEGGRRHGHVGQGEAHGLVHLPLCGRSQNSSMSPRASAQRSAGGIVVSVRSRHTSVGPWPGTGSVPDAGRARPIWTAWSAPVARRTRRTSARSAE